MGVQTALHWLGILLIVASIVVGILWAVTKRTTLEPVAFVLATAGALLLVL